MKKGEDIVRILEAFDLTGSDRATAELARWRAVTQRVHVAS